MPLNKLPINPVLNINLTPLLGTVDFVNIFANSSWNLSGDTVLIFSDCFLISLSVFGSKLKSNLAANCIALIILNGSSSNAFGLITDICLFSMSNCPLPSMSCVSPVSTSLAIAFIQKSLRI